MIKEYEVMLEGKHGDLGYFVTFKVCSKNDDRARELSLQRAKEKEFEIVNIEGVEKLDEILNGKEMLNSLLVNPTLNEKSKVQIFLMSSHRNQCQIT